MFYTQTQPIAKYGNLGWEKNGVKMTKKATIERERERKLN